MGRVSLIRSSAGQQEVRNDLADIVVAHMRSQWRRPIAVHSKEAFQAIRSRVEDSSCPLIIDSCCGTGDSTRHLAAQFPDALVLGVDKSAHRLARHQLGESENYAVLRADVNDFWRLAAAAGWRPVRHYLLYPNPYPKASQIRKRWYGSPAFPSLLGLGGLLTVRTNWSIYAQEFVLALRAAGCAATESQITGVPPMSAFEAKYQERDHRLYQVTSDLGLEHVVRDKLDLPAGLVFPEVGD
jgi:tRNA G46 methylase TrmB